MCSSRKLKDLSRKVNKFYEKGRIQRIRYYKEEDSTKKSSYYFDKYLFRTYFAVVLCVVILALAVLGLRGGAYAHCPEDAIGGTCDNPLYEHKDFWGRPCEYEACLKETLRAGETVGEKPPEAIGIIIFNIVTFGFASLLINHIRQKENKRLYRGQHNNKK